MLIQPTSDDFKAVGFNIGRIVIAFGLTMLVRLFTAVHAIRSNLKRLFGDKSSANLPLDRVPMEEFNRFVRVPEIEELQLRYLPKTMSIG